MNKNPALHQQDMLLLEKSIQLSETSYSILIQNS